MDSRIQRFPTEHFWVIMIKEPLDFQRKSIEPRKPGSKLAAETTPVGKYTKHIIENSYNSFTLLSCGSISELFFKMASLSKLSKAQLLIMSSIPCDSVRLRHFIA